jgi:putative heme-binding domain-containing protein
MNQFGLIRVLPFLLLGQVCVAEVTDQTAKYKVAAGFKLEKIYDVKKEEGSWVALTEDGKGRLIAADQYGKLYRVTPAPLAGGETKVEPLNIPVGGAHGLLWHEGMLYIVVNEKGKEFPVESGVWMVKETADGWEAPKLVIPVKAGGEHGVHSVVLSPDKQWIYLVTGNFTALPAVTDSFPAKIWDEDQLLPRNPDGNGHAANIFAPGGWIARFKPDGTSLQLVSMGQRNTYDVAFHQSGELFSYDADMEWDFGMPWYRPTRIMHVVPGAEMGWRNGTGKWPEYYEDSIAPVLNIGPGSPVGLLSGSGFKAPAKYQHAIYAFDWTFATIYAVHLTPNGASFDAVKEEFVAGAGLPLTDGIITKDGTMYFATGGRRTSSALWRVTYTGTEPTAPAPGKFAASPNRDKLAGYTINPATAKVEEIWELLGSEERTIRFMAKAALERLPDTSWAAKLKTEKDVSRIIAASMALARLDAKTHRDLVLGALDRIEWSKLSTHQKMNWLRAAGLVFMRSGEPTDAEKAKLLAKIDASYPSTERFLNYELARMLCYLQAPGVVARTLDLMDKEPAPEPEPWAELISRNGQYGGSISRMMEDHPPTAQIHYLYCLRVVKGPWKQGERQRVFAWFREVDKSKGGNSFGKFMIRIREQVYENGTAEEKRIYAADAKAPAQNLMADLPNIAGPGKAWTVDEVVKLAESGLEGRDKKKGENMYRASLCAACHRFGALGGAQGPDLSNLAGRFTVKDIAEAIIEPSKVISDQYGFHAITTNDGKMTVGKILEEKDEVLIIANNPFDYAQKVEVKRSDIKENKLSDVSPMPAGMINRMNPEELKDLLAYLLGK